MSNRQWFLLVAGIVVVVTLASALRGVVGATIVPFVFGGAWEIYTRLSEIPQIYLWGGIVLVFLAAGSGSLMMSANRAFMGEDRPVSPALHHQPGRIARLVVDLDDIRRGPFFRRKIFDHVSALTVAALEQRELPTSREVARLLEEEELELAPHLRRYLIEGRRRRDDESEPNNQSRIRRQLGRSTNKDGHTWRDPQLAELVALMEKELEVRHRDD